MDCACAASGHAAAAPPSADMNCRRPMSITFAPRPQRDRARRNITNNITAQTASSIQRGFLRLPVLFGADPRRTDHFTPTFALVPKKVRHRRGRIANRGGVYIDEPLGHVRFMDRVGNS